MRQQVLELQAELIDDPLLESAKMTGYVLNNVYVMLIHITRMADAMGQRPLQSAKPLVFARGNN
ncbi:MAG: hypothetical protein AAGA91_18705 [Pseudomonadota bacterium]